MQAHNMIPNLIQMNFMRSILGNNNNSTSPVAGGGYDNSLYNIIFMVILSEIFTKIGPFIWVQVSSWVYSYYKNKTAEMVQNGVLNKRKTSSMYIERNYAQTNNNNSGDGNVKSAHTSSYSSMNDYCDSIIDYIGQLPQCRMLQLTSNGYMIPNHKEEIVMQDNIYVKVLSKVFGEGNTDTTSQSNNLSKIVIEVYSYNLDLPELKKYLDELRDDFLIKKNNRLGSQLYYFEEAPQILNRTLDGVVNYDTANPYQVFKMRRFFTTKRMENMYGFAINKIRARLKWFTNNYDWYLQKGIPYTFGVLLSGPPGVGKTSIIKAIANDTGRHPFSINLSDHTTTTQLENLFFSDHVVVEQDGQINKYKIPINKRLIIIEDIDAMTKLVERRDKKLFDPKILQEIQPASQFASNGLMQSAGQFASQEQVRRSQVRRAEEHPNRLTLSKLLNLLDGVLETPGRIIIMTTNHPEELDHALIRPGRMDLCIQLKNTTRDEVCEIVEEIGETTIENPNEIPDDKWTPAEVMQKLFEHMHEPEKAINELKYGKTLKEEIYGETETGDIIEDMIPNLKHPEEKEEKKEKEEKEEKEEKVIDSDDELMNALDLANNVIT